MTLCKLLVISMVIPCFSRSGTNLCSHRWQSLRLCLVKPSAIENLPTMWSETRSSKIRRCSNQQPNVTNTQTIWLRLNREHPVQQLVIVELGSERQVTQFSRWLPKMSSKMARAIITPKKRGHRWGITRVRHLSSTPPIRLNSITTKRPTFWLKMSSQLLSKTI